MCVDGAMDFTFRHVAIAFTDRQHVGRRGAEEPPYSANSPFSASSDVVRRSRRQAHCCRIIRHRRQYPPTMPPPFFLVQPLWPHGIQARAALGAKVLNPHAKLWTLKLARVPEWLCRALETPSRWVYTLADGGGGERRCKGAEGILTKGEDVEEGVRGHLERPEVLFARGSLHERA